MSLEKGQLVIQKMQFLNYKLTSNYPIGVLGKLTDCAISKLGHFSWPQEQARFFSLFYSL
jgi:hypothetical protein